MFVTISQSDYWETILKTLQEQGMKIPEGVDPMDIMEVELDVKCIEVFIRTIQDV